MYLTTQPCLKGWTFRWIRMFAKVSFIEEDIGYQRIVRLEPSLFMEFIFILWPMWSIESQQITQRKRLRYRWLNKRSNSHTSENDQSLRIERQSQWGPRARKLFKSVWFAKQEEWSGSPDGGSSREPTSWLRICWSQRLQSLLTGMEKVLLVSYWLVRRETLSRWELLLHQPLQSRALCEKPQWWDPIWDKIPGFLKRKVKQSINDLQTDKLINKKDFPWRWTCILLYWARLAELIQVEEVWTFFLLVSSCSCERRDLVLDQQEK